MGVGAMNISRGPWVSIITPCLNRADRIQAAIESVRAQTYDGPLEHLVLDGGSTDGTLELLQRYPDVTFRSEPDQNLYHAINKGIAMAQGSIIGFLNSDDVYSRDAIAKAVDVLQQSPAAAMACGGAEVVDAKGACLRVYDNAENRSLKFRDLLFAVPIINARFFRRALFDRVGPFDIRYATIADREFLLRVVLAGEGATTIDAIVYTYTQHADSLTIGAKDSWQRFSRENMQMVEDWLSRGSFPPPCLADLLTFHAHSMLMGVAAAARRGDLTQILTTVRRGQRLDPWWATKVPGIIATWVLKRLTSRKS
jgi:glycosyltransferase involved in cell wall biosynthesis